MNHNINNSYIKDDIVLHEGRTYIAKQDVSAGVPVTNTTFWEELVTQAPAAG
jgi:hypothetical protein